MKKINIFVMLSIIISSSVLAQKTGLTTAKNTADAFFKNKGKSSVALQLCYTKVSDNDTLLYIFNNNNKGFVIVSGNQSASPILAYSMENAFDANAIAPALDMWLNWYASGIKNANKKMGMKKNPEWDQILSGQNKKDSKIVAPLVTSKWNQDANYNYHCPEHPNGPGGHCYAGCVSTAMSQIMYYYKYPEVGVGSFSYNHPYYGTLTANFGQTTYDWASMTNIINSGSKEAISLLMYHCGVSVSMNYEPGGSGAQSEDAAYAFKNFFHYRLTAKTEYKSLFTKEDWWALLRNELDEQRPMLYSGSGSSGGHAWVCDGYQDTLFHFNWGWGGANNAYFKLDTLDSGNGDFSVGQSAIIGIIPYFAPYCLEDRTITDEFKTISDGSGQSLCWNNTDCQWLLQPGNGDVILSFTDFNTEEGKDIVSIYNGTTTNAPLLGQFSGTTNPGTIIANSGSMLITFITDAQNQSEGWKAEYISGHVGIDEVNKNDLILFPNPVNDCINIIFPQGSQRIESVRIYNLAGQSVWEKGYENLEDVSLKLDLSALPAGLYNIVAISKDSKCFNGKILKQ